MALGLAAPQAPAQPVAPPRSATSITDFRVNDPALMDARAAVLRRAESELAQGDTAAANETFDRAAMMLHAPDTEMGLARTYMQAGQYRRALAFCAHTAGTHRESPSAGALYAWLLRAGGQVAFAERVLNETLARAPQDPVSLEVRRTFAQPRPQASDLLLQTPHRLAPQAVMAPGQAAVPDAARVVASGVLIRDGTLALVPNAAVRSAPSGMLWVRNGLGQTTRARIDEAASKTLEALGVAVLRLDAALEPPSSQAVALREPFAGSPGFAMEYAESGTAAPAWPWMSQGFFGALQANGGLRRLGIDLAEGPHGGPVLDAQGRLAGIALPGSEREAVVLPASRWQDLPGIAAADAPPSRPDAASPAAPAGPSATRPAVQAYESGLRLALQVIALP
jgi:tetratricopeptide (TPR) repeat protein